MINNKSDTSNRALPDLMISLTLPIEFTAAFGEIFFTNLE